MDGLNIDLDELGIVVVAPDEGIALSQQISEVISLKPDGENTLEDFFANDDHPSFEELTVANHSSPPLHSDDVFSSVLPPTADDTDNRGADPRENDELLCIDKATHAGDKRCLEDLESSQPCKHSKTSSFASPSPKVVFTPPLLASSSINPAMGPAASSTALRLPPTNPDSIKMLGCSIVAPDGDIMALTPSDVEFMREVSIKRVASESLQSTQAPFMSMRVGSAYVPSRISEFNKSLGSHVYVSHSAMLLKDDARDPSQAKNLISAMTPPLLTFDAEQRSLEDLIARQTLHSFHAVVNGNLLQRRMESIVSDLHNTISGFQKEKETISGECSSLKVALEAVSKDRDELSLKNSVLAEDVQMRDNALGFKDEDLRAARLEIEKLKVELSKEKQLGEDLAIRVERGDSFLASFPEVFRVLLDHADFKGPFNTFNNAAINARERRCYVNILKYLQKENSTIQILLCHPNATQELKHASVSWKAKTFPIVDEVPSLARCMDIQGLLAYLSSPPEPAVGASSLEAASRPASASESAPARTSLESAPARSSLESASASASLEAASRPASQSSQIPTFGVSESSSALSSTLSHP